MSRALGFLVVPAGVVILALVSRRLPSARRPLALGLDSRWMPLLLGAVSCFLSAWIWGSLDAPSRIHDEAAYLLQARIFASGSWSAPPPPLPEFFQQFHVMVTPRLAPKYWPGHGLLLVPGTLLGLPALMPVLLSGLAGGLIFALGRRIAGGPAAAIGWSLWLTGEQLAVWRATYLPVTSSTALWLGGAYFLERWWRRGRRTDLVLLSLTASGLAITRPLTAVAFALPVLYAVLLAAHRKKLWRQLPSAIAAGVLVLAIVPVWSHSSTGSWRDPPYLAYRLIPLSVAESVPGDSAAVSAGPFVPADFLALRDFYRPMREAHSLETMPELLVARIRKSFSDLFLGPAWRAGLAAFFLLGVVALDGRGRLALAWPLALYLLHLPRPHFSYWSVYYAETLGIVAVATGAGLCWTFRRLSGRAAPLTAVAGTAVLVVALLGGGLVGCTRAKQRIHSSRAVFVDFRSLLRQLPDGQRTVIFVRYPERHDPNRSFVQNPPDYAAAQHWLVHDRGDENDSLLAVAPDRVPYLFDEETFRLTPLPIQGSEEFRQHPSGRPKRPSSEEKFTPVESGLGSR